MEHNAQLFAKLVSEFREFDPSVRIGQTFGWPAVYVGSRLVACVFGNSIGVKVPKALADAAIASGRFVRFRPYGMPTSPLWVQLPSDLYPGSETQTLLRQAVQFAEGSLAAAPEPVLACA